MVFGKTNRKMYVTGIQKDIQYNIKYRSGK